MVKQWLSSLTLILCVSAPAYSHGTCSNAALHDYMIDIKDDLKLLSTDIKSENYDSAVSHVDNLVSHFEKSRKELPYHLRSEEASDIERQKYIELIDEGVLIFTDLRLAIQESDSVGIRKLFGKMGALRNKGHRGFKQSCE